jgi:hypothetical protein
VIAADTPAWPFLVVNIALVVVEERLEVVCPIRKDRGRIGA